MNETTKKCPICAKEIKAEARVCRYCRAKFDVTIKGYCFRDHQLIEADENGNCPVCHGELIDMHVDSKLIEGTTPEAAPASQAIPMFASIIQPAPEEQPPPIPATTDSKDLKPAEIHCHKCSTINPTTAITCQQCSTDLLPGTSMATRLIILAVMIIGAIASGMGTKYLFSQPDIPSSWWLFLGFLTISLPILGLQAAFATTPPHERYYARAQHHLKLNPLQAIADLNQARKLAPQKEKEKYILEATKLQVGVAGNSVADTHALIQICTEALVTATHKSKAELLNVRAGLYVKLSMEEQSTRDLLEATNEIEKAIKNGEFNASKEGQALANIVTGDGEGWTFGVSRQNVKQATVKIYNRRLQLMKEGKIKAIGYCPKCKDAVVLNIDGGCEECGRIPNHKEAIYIMPADLEQTITNVRQKRGIQ